MKTKLKKQIEGNSVTIISNDDNESDDNESDAM